MLFICQAEKRVGYLDDLIASGAVKAYTEGLFANLIERRGLRLMAARCDTLRWYEIDCAETSKWPRRLLPWVIKLKGFPGCAIPICHGGWGVRIMLHYLKDTANAVTAVGIVCSGALNNQYEFAVAVALWAIVADDIDGEIARRSSGGAVDTKAIGKSLDGFSDLIFGSVIPAIIICSAIENAFLSTCFGAFLLLVGSLRLNYFDHFGLNTEGYSTGLPLSYDLPILAFILIFIPLTALHVLPFTIRASGPIVHFFTIACCIGGSGVLVLLR